MKSNLSGDDDEFSDINKKSKALVKELESLKD
jgi:hypothetical protein